ncbi:uncharacterized protein LOC144164853 [Haemaphysalis longicornis]
MDDEGLLRVGGRLHKLNASIDVKHPILLPVRHTFTYLIVLAAHQHTLHGGVEATLTETRERFWIVKGRQTVKKVLAQCLTCRRRRLTAQTAPFAPLPSDRIPAAHPFSVSVLGADSNGSRDKPSSAKTLPVRISRIIILGPGEDVEKKDEAGVSTHQDHHRESFEDSQ